MKRTKKRKTYAFPEEATITRYSPTDHRKFLALSWQTDDSLKSRFCVNVRIKRSSDLSTAVNIWFRHKMSSADVIAGMNRIRRRDGKVFGARTMRTLMSMKPSVRFLEIAAYGPRRRRAKPAAKGNTGEIVDPTSAPLGCPDC